MKISKSIIILSLVIFSIKAHLERSQANNEVQSSQGRHQIQHQEHDNFQIHTNSQAINQQQHIHDHNCNHQHFQEHIKAKDNIDESKSHQYERKVDQIRKKYIEELDSQTTEQKIFNFFESCQKEVGEWVSLPKEKSLKSALESCQIFKHQQEILLFYEQLCQLGPNLKKQHSELLAKLFRQYKNVAPSLKCLADLREFQNKFFAEKKKYKYLNQFINSKSDKTLEAFPQHKNYSLKGEKTCHFLKFFFEYYYIQVVSSFQTLSSSFMRALTLRSNVFNHYDISYCLSLDTMGALSEALQDLDINNIYIKVPKVYHELNYLKLKQKCKDQQNKNLVANLRNALQGLDMFNIMFNQYQPFVQIAAQKFGNTQIRLLARKFAEIIDNRERYLGISKKNQKSTKTKTQQL